MEAIDRNRGALLGLACGDAVGTTVKFIPRGSFAPVTDMRGGGPFSLMTVRVSASHGKVTLSGALSALETTALTFVVNETTVSYSSSKNFANGAQADFADGVNVKVNCSLSSYGTTVVASRFTFN